MSVSAYLCMSASLCAFVYVCVYLVGGVSACLCAYLCFGLTSNEDVDMTQHVLIKRSRHHIRNKLGAFLRS